MDEVDLAAVAELFLDDLDTNDGNGITPSLEPTPITMPDPVMAPFELPLDNSALLGSLLMSEPPTTNDAMSDATLLDDIDILLMGEVNHTTGAPQYHLPPPPQPIPSTTTAPDRPPPKRKPRRSPNYNPNKARNERRHELIYLRNKVAEMEKELTQLRDKAYLPIEDALIDPAQRHLANVTRRRQGIWEKIAGRQLNERRRVQRDNERLKILLETQLKIATSLESLLHKRQVSKMEEDKVLGVCNRVSENAPVHTDAAIFDELRRQADGVYEDAKKLFDGLNIDFVEQSCRDARVRDTEKGVFMEIFAADLLPFPLDATSKAAWQYFSHNKNKTPFRLFYERVSEVNSSTEDTIAENSALEMYVNNTKAVFRLKQVLRRFISDERTVISFSCVAEPFEFAEKPVSGCAFREWGCMILTKPDSKDAADMSLLQTVYFVTPEFFGDPQNEVVGELTEFVLSSTSATMHAWFQMIENILLDDSLGH